MTARSVAYTKSIKYTSTFAPPPWVSEIKTGMINRRISKRTPGGERRNYTFDLENATQQNTSLVVYESTQIYRTKDRKGSEK